MLNLPQQVDILSPVGEARNTYVYAANGTKLQVVKKYNSNYNSSPIIGSAVNTSNLDVTKTTDYVGNLIFENDVLDRILVDGGYIKDGVYYFYEADHLGDNRTVVNQSGTVTERNDYYPYGMQMGHNELTNSASGTDNKYKYNGKELDVMHGLNLYDYAARMQDPTLGRFTTMDPLAEKYYGISPYAYCAGNPINAVDVDGNLTIYINGQKPTSQSKEDYWNGFSGEFNNHFNEKHTMYADGSCGGWNNTLTGIITDENWNLMPVDRARAGADWAKSNVGSIITQLHRTDGVIDEKLRIVTHSFGGKFGKAVIGVIMDFVKEHPELCKGLSIDNYDFDPLNGASMTANPNVFTYEAIHHDPHLKFSSWADRFLYYAMDAYNGHFGFLANQQEKGLDRKDRNHFFKDDSKYSNSHSINSFTHLISTLPQGTYVWNGTNWVVK